jgi:hypothetical protein
MKKSTSSMFPWMDFGFNNMAFQGAMLAIEAQQVIALRLTKMAMGGPVVQREAELMVSEKMEALSQSGQMLLMGALGGKSDLGAAGVLSLYRKKVQANRKRLTS